MDIALLTRDKGQRHTLVATDTVFHSFTDVAEYCLDVGIQTQPKYDCICKAFKILDSGETFDVAIGMKNDEVYVKFGEYILTE